MADSKMLDLDTEQKPSRRLWIFAGVAALALHVGCAALAIAQLRTDDPDDTLGAPAIEIGLEIMAPKVEATDLPPGPDTDASVASPALAADTPASRLAASRLVQSVRLVSSTPGRLNAMIRSAR